MALNNIITKKYDTAICTLCVDTFESAVGKICAAADDDFLYIVAFEDSKNLEKMYENLAKELSCNFVMKSNQLLNSFQCELNDYFNGKLKKFSVSLKTYGSEFQKDVWDRLQQVPYGATQTYGGIAKGMGRQASHSRAVGAACGANAHVLVIPCHRVVASGSKGGFSSGIDRKEWLLNHEEKYAV